MTDITNPTNTGVNLAAALIFTKLVLDFCQVEVEAAQFGEQIRSGAIDPDPKKVSALVAQLDAAGEGFRIVFNALEQGGIAGIARA